MQDKRILVTGATGFIGQYLIRKLIELGYQPSGISRNGGEVDELSISAVDIVDENAINSFISKNPIDYIFHLASYIPKTPDKNYFKKCIDVNVIGTKNTLIAAKKYNVKRFIYSSSFAVCNASSSINVKEEQEAPGNEYGITKLACEHLCKFFDDSQMSTTILRYASVYGFNQEPYCVLPNFINKMKNDIPIEIFGDGSSSFDFVYIKDVVNATIIAGLEDKIGTFNIGTGNETTIKELAEVFKKVFPDAKISFDYSKIDIGKRFSFDISKQTKLLNYTPRYSLIRGIREYRDMLEGLN